MSKFIITTPNKPFQITNPEFNFKFIKSDFKGNIIEIDPPEVINFNFQKDALGQGSRLFNITWDVFSLQLILDINNSDKTARSTNEAPISVNNSFKENIITSDVYVNGKKFYLKGDTYNFIIQFFGSDGNNFTIQVSISRDTSSYVSSNNSSIVNQLPPNLQLTKNASNQNKVLVPILLIEGQTLVDGIDLSDMKFTISDEFTYYEPKPLLNTKCGIYFIDPSELKETIFRKCCPKISLFPVLRGKGKTAFDKALYLYEKDKEIQNSVQFYVFYYENLILYAMSKYILSRILYGKFNMKFLLEKYDKEFYQNLGKSRFCGALAIFNGPDELASYNKYFKYDLKCDK